MKALPTIRALAAAVIAFGSFTAANAAIVTTWDYSIASYWSGYAPAGVTLSSDHKTLTWGEGIGFGQSSLVITDPLNGSVDTIIGGGMPTPANIAEGLTLSHINHPISLVSALTSAELTSQLTLVATAPAGTEGGPGGLDPVSFNIKFSETPNVEPCAAPSPAGNPCNDIFVLTSGLLNASFTYLGQNYFVNIFPLIDGALSVLSNAECAAAGAANGCIGLTTIENEISLLPFGVTISTQPLQVPEPNVLALLGIGLFAAGALRTRRKQAS